MDIIFWMLEKKLGLRNECVYLNLDYKPGLNKLLIAWNGKSMLFILQYCFYWASISLVLNKRKLLVGVFTYICIFCLLCLFMIFCKRKRQMQHPIQIASISYHYILTTLWLNIIWFVFIFRFFCHWLLSVCFPFLPNSSFITGTNWMSLGACVQ